MVAADAVLEAIPGPQSRERLANRVRLASLHGASRRPQLAAINR
jgi:hypothetical protein